MQAATCVHTNSFPQVREGLCGKPAFLLRTHGFLCLAHYRHQQQYALPAPRKRQPKWKGLPLTNDDEIIADIINTDSMQIAASVVKVVRFGSLEPIYVRYAHAKKAH